MTATIIDGRKIAKQIQNQLKHELETLEKHYHTKPQISTIVIGDDPNSELYLRLRDKACNEVGISSTHHSFPSTVTEKKIIEVINQLNADSSVHGILVQLPLPTQLSPTNILGRIDPKKDVEGFHPMNMGKLLSGDEHLVPCTPLAVLTILDHEHIELKGKNAVIVNHSMVVGKPLAALFLNRNATVTICHVFTKNLQQYTIDADVLVSATGVPKLITVDHIKLGASVIDVGIVQTKEGICGDVDFQEVKEKAGILTPVPGGVGPVTIVCSLQNMVKTFQNCVRNNK